MHVCVPKLFIDYDRWNVGGVLPSFSSSRLSCSSAVGLSVEVKCRFVTFFPQHIATHLRSKEDREFRPSILVYPSLSISAFRSCQMSGNQSGQATSRGSREGRPGLPGLAFSRPKMQIWLFL